MWNILFSLFNICSMHTESTVQQEFKGREDMLHKWYKTCHSHICMYKNLFHESLRSHSHSFIWLWNWKDFSMNDKTGRNISTFKEKPTWIVDDRAQNVALLFKGIFLIFLKRNFYIHSENFLKTFSIFINIFVFNFICNRSNFEKLRNWNVTFRKNA